MQDALLQRFTLASQQPLQSFCASREDCIYIHSVLPGVWSGQTCARIHEWLQTDVLWHSAGQQLWTLCASPTYTTSFLKGLLLTQLYMQNARLHIITLPFRLSTTRKTCPKVKTRSEMWSSWTFKSDWNYHALMIRYRGCSMATVWGSILVYISAEVTKSGSAAIRGANVRREGMPC